MMSNIIEIKNLVFGYEEDRVLNNISLEVKPGEIVLIEGENGAGKTTFLKCMTGLLNNGKSIYINNKEVYKNRYLLKQNSFVMSEDFLYDYMTTNENIVFFQKIFKEDSVFIDQVNQYLKDFEIEKYKDTLIKNLSQGTRSKVNLAIMLSKKHKLLILDEPFTALDVNTQEKLISLSKKYVLSKEKAIVMVTHIKEFKKIATRVVEIKKEG
ncbi:MAG: ABC transporter ATP-binding protein [Lachnobacterium sp.]|uniref:ABC-2 type transport system ATP-binding protein n=2 Tax=Lachnobacterium bovis TaxID=140626 RepID=A0A1H3IH45_9FIRM|nr:ABC transporter ATP-binding protein [Lachnobacterium sp.]SDY26937.1 ABC-2 type transport system ATP-binding protein [Lachnobacterium bovis DSM 14045]